MMTNLITVLVVQLPALAAAAFAIWKAVAAKAKILEHTQRMTSSTPFQTSELDMIGHAARSMAKDYLQDIAERQGAVPTALGPIPSWAQGQIQPGEKTP
jgi:hypothetical protein